MSLYFLNYLFFSMCIRVRVRIGTTKRFPILAIQEVNAVKVIPHKGYEPHQPSNPSITTFYNDIGLLKLHIPFNRKGKH